MSLVNLVVRQKGSLYGTCIHWRQLLALFDARLHGIKEFMFAKQVRVRPYDAGIVVVDFDRRLILSFQVGFRICDISRDSYEWFNKNFSFIDYTTQGFSAMKKDLSINGFEVDQDWWN